MKIALTFDIERDIPNLLDTYSGVKIGLIKILEILDSFKIKGTFFCTGTVVKHFPENIRLIEQKGHEIACHGLNHERLTYLNLNDCQELIFQNKKLIEETCTNTNILGFRAPYLKPPKFLFEILENLGFRYDSSISSPKELKHYQTRKSNIQEFHPRNYSTFFRLPLGNNFVRRATFNKDLAILFFHPWEAVDIKDLITTQISKFKKFKNIMFRPERWVNTGDLFLRKLKNLIKESFSRAAEFIMLKELVIQNLES